MCYLWIIHSVWMYFIKKHQYTSAYGAAALLGVGGSTLLITALTMLADLIGENVVCCLYKASFRNFQIVQLQKVSIPTPRKVTGNSGGGGGIPKGGGISKAKFFKGKYEAKLEFPKGWGFKPKKTSMVGVRVFYGTTTTTK